MHFRPVIVDTLPRLPRYWGRQDALGLYNSAGTGLFICAQVKLISCHFLGMSCQRFFARWPLMSFRLVQSKPCGDRGVVAARLVARMARPGSPSSDSILMTFAPRSPSIMVETGPNCQIVQSTTLMPSRGHLAIGCSPLPFVWLGSVSSFTGVYNCGAVIDSSRWRRRVGTQERIDTYTEPNNFVKSSSLVTRASLAAAPTADSSIPAPRSAAKDLDVLTRPK